MNKKWIACDIEDSYFGDDRKIHKNEKKKRKAKDRSKFKKTDQGKLFQQVNIPNDTKHVEGKVLSITPQGIHVEYDGKLFICSLRGAMKKEKTLQKNLITVGDQVLFDILNKGEGLIAYVKPRKSILSRADNLSRNKEQLIAANIDLVLIVCSVVMPPLKTPLIDRYIIAAAKGGMQPVIIINKIDLMNEDTLIGLEEKKLLSELVKSYETINIPVILVSTKTGEGIQELQEIMKDKTSVFSGQSGVGKTSLINYILGSEFKTSNPVERTKKGAHTTSTTNLIPLKEGGFCIDTPGIKSFGVWDLKLDEIENYFSEINEIGKNCKFLNCSHTEEEGCAVISALEHQKISSLRYLSYLSLRESVQENYLRR